MRWWESRLKEKPVAITGASTGNNGTINAQFHLRHIALYLDMHVITHPMVLIRQAATMFDAEGNLTDPKSQKYLAKLTNNLIELTLQLKK